jgi:hypothetical protein
MYNYLIMLSVDMLNVKLDVIIGNKIFKSHITTNISKMF